MSPPQRGGKVAGERGQTPGRLGVAGEVVGGPAGLADAGDDEKQGEQGKDGNPERPIEKIGDALPVHGGVPADEAGLLENPKTPSSLTVVGSSEPPQASSSNGRSSARAKIPRKSRGVLITIHSLCLWGRGGMARPYIVTNIIHGFYPPPTEADVRADAGVPDA